MTATETNTLISDDLCSILFKLIYRIIQLHQVKMMCESSTNILQYCTVSYFLWLKKNLFNQLAKCATLSNQLSLLTISEMHVK